MTILHWVKFLNIGLDKDKDKKERLFKRLKSIEDKNQEQPNALGKIILADKNANYESNFHYDLTYNFHKFYRDFKKFKNMASLDSKRCELTF